MAINEFLAAATAVAQVDTFTPATIEIDDVFTLTVTGFDGTSDTVNYTAVDTSATTVSGALIAAWNAKTESLFTGITASGTATVILTADTAGVAFKVASSAVDGGGTDTQTFTRAATTKNEGPSDWSSTENWSEGTIPGATAGEDTYIANSSVDILYGLDQSAAAQTLDSLHISQSYTGKIGHNGVTGLVGDYLQVKVTAFFLGEFFQPNPPAGSGRIKIDFGTVQAAISVLNTGSAEDTNKPAFRMLCNHASTSIVEIRKGTVGVAFGPGETSLLLDAAISYITQPKTDATLTLGIGVSITTVDCIGGVTSLLAAATTVYSRAGTLLTDGAGAITTLNISGGVATPNSTGTITTVNLTNGGTCDFTGSEAARTVTNMKMDASSILKYEPSVMTFTNGIESVSASGRRTLRAS